MKQEKLFSIVKEMNLFTGSRHFLKDEFESHIKKKKVPYSNLWFPELRRRNLINTSFGKYSLVKLSPSDVMNVYDEIKRKFKVK